jgi:hypothetical protein
MESNIWEMAWNNTNYIVYGLFVFGIGDLNYEKSWMCKKVI